MENANMTIPRDRTKLRNLIKDQKAIFSTNIGEFAPRIAEPPSMPIILRSDPTDDRDAIVASLLERFPRQCKGIHAPVTNVYDYFDHYDVHLQGTAMTMSVLLEIAMMNTERGKQINRFTEQWKNTHFHRFMSFDINASDVFTSEEKQGYSEDFLQDSLEHLRTLRRSMPQEIQPFTTGTMFSMQRYLSLPLSAHSVDSTSVASFRPLTHGNNSARLASPASSGTPSPASVYHSGPELGEAFDISRNIKLFRPDETGRSSSLPATLPSSHRYQLHPNDERNISIQAGKAILHRGFQGWKNSSSRIRQHNMTFDKAEFRRPRGLSLANAPHQSEAHRPSPNTNLDRNMLRTPRLLPLHSTTKPHVSDYLPYKVDDHITHQVSGSSGLLPLQVIKPLQPIQQNIPFDLLSSIQGSHANMSSFRGEPLNHAMSPKRQNGSGEYQLLSNPHNQNLQQYGTRSTRLNHFKDPWNIHNPPARISHGQFLQQSWSNQYPGLVDDSLLIDGINNAHSGQRRSSNPSQRPPLSFSNESRVATHNGAQPHQELSSGAKLGLQGNHQSPQLPYHRSRRPSTGKPPRRSSFTRLSPQSWEHKPPARGGYSIAGFFGGGSGSSDHSRYAFPQIDEKALSNSPNPGQTPNYSPHYPFPMESPTRFSGNTTLLEVQLVPARDSTIVKSQAVIVRSNNELPTGAEPNTSASVSNDIEDWSRQSSHKLGGQISEQEDIPAQPPPSIEPKNRQPAKRSLNRSSHNDGKATKLFVAGFNITKGLLLYLFAPFGPVVNIDGPIVPRKYYEQDQQDQHQSRSNAWVTLPSTSNAIEAIENLDGLASQKGNGLLKVEFALERSWDGSRSLDGKMHYGRQALSEATRSLKAEMGSKTTEASGKVKSSKSEAVDYESGRQPSSNEGRDTKIPRLTNTESLRLQGEHLAGPLPASNADKTLEVSKQGKLKSSVPKRKVRKGAELDKQLVVSGPGLHTVQIPETTPGKKYAQRQSNTQRITPDRSGEKLDFSQSRPASLGDFLGSPKAKRVLTAGKSSNKGVPKQKFDEGSSKTNLNDQRAPTGTTTPMSVPDTEDHNDLWKKVPIALNQAQQQSEDISSNYPNSQGTSTDPEHGTISEKASDKKELAKKQKSPTYTKHKENLSSRVSVESLLGIQQGVQPVSESTCRIKIEAEEEIAFLEVPLASDSFTPASSDKASTSDRITTDSQTEYSDSFIEGSKLRTIAVSKTQVSEHSSPVHKDLTAKYSAPSLQLTGTTASHLAIDALASHQMPVLQSPTDEPSFAAEVPNDNASLFGFKGVGRLTKPSGPDEDCEEVSKSPNHHRGKVTMSSSNALPSDNASWMNTSTIQDKFQGLRAPLSKSTDSDLTISIKSPKNVKRRPQPVETRLQAITSTAMPIESEDSFLSLSSAKRKDRPDIPFRSSSLSVPSTPISTHKKKKKTFTPVRAEYPTTEIESHSSTKIVKAETVSSKHEQASTESSEEHASSKDASSETVHQKGEYSVTLNTELDEAEELISYRQANLKRNDEQENVANEAIQDIYKTPSLDFSYKDDTDPRKRETQDTASFTSSPTLVSTSPMNKDNTDSTVSQSQDMSVTETATALPVITKKVFHNLTHLEIDTLSSIRDEEMFPPLQSPTKPQFTDAALPAPSKEKKEESEAETDGDFHDRINEYYKEKESKYLLELRVVTNATNANPADTNVSAAKSSMNDIFPVADLAAGTQHMIAEVKTQPSRRSSTETSLAASNLSSATSPTARKLFSEIVSSPTKATTKRSKGKGTRKAKGKIIDLETEGGDTKLYDGDVITVGASADPRKDGRIINIDLGAAKDAEGILKNFGGESKQEIDEEKDPWDIPEGERRWGSQCNR